MSEKHAPSHIVLAVDSLAERMPVDILLFIALAPPAWTYYISLSGILCSTVDQPSRTLVHTESNQRVSPAIMNTNASRGSVRRTTFTG